MSLGSMPIFFQLQQQQQGQQQALGLQPVQPQQPLVSRGNCRIFWAGARVATGWVLSLMEMGSVAAWGRGLCKLARITICLPVLTLWCLQCHATSTALNAIRPCAQCRWRHAHFACILSWPRVVAVIRECISWGSTAC